MGICALLRETRFESEFCFSFARHTTIGCGGTAALAVSPADTESLRRLLGICTKENVPHCFLGAGANVLPAEGQYRGIVVRFCRMNALLHEGNVLFAGAGVTGGALLKFAMRNAIGGFEPFTGIPMTVGGACVMNAGVAERHFGELVLRVVAVEGGRVRVLSQAECRFGEKESIFRGSGLAVAGVMLRAEFSPMETIAANIAAYREKRSHLPKGRSMGCAFVNPAGRSAGALIEACGLKGKRIGGAFVSPQHANFIINDGGSADDVDRLARYIQREVRERTSISLREEFCRLP